MHRDGDARPGLHPQPGRHHRPGCPRWSRAVPRAAADPVWCWTARCWRPGGTVCPEVFQAVASRTMSSADEAVAEAAPGPGWCSARSSSTCCTWTAATCSTTPLRERVAVMCVLLPEALRGAPGGRRPSAATVAPRLRRGGGRGLRGRGGEEPRRGLYAAGRRTRPGSRSSRGTPSTWWVTGRRVGLRSPAGLAVQPASRPPAIPESGRVGHARQDLQGPDRRAADLADRASSSAREVAPRPRTRSTSTRRMVVEIACRRAAGLHPLSRRRGAAVRPRAALSARTRPPPTPTPCRPSRRSARSSARACLLNQCHVTPCGGSRGSSPLLGLVRPARSG